MKKKLGKIGIFILGVMATIIITKMGDKIIPNDNNVVVDNIKDTIFVIEVNNPKLQKTESTNNTKELAKEIQYWKNIANHSSNRINTIEKKLNNLEKIKANKQQIINTKNSNINNKEIENSKKESNQSGNSKYSKEAILDNRLNQIISKIENYFPKMDGYSYSGKTKLLELDCPDFNNDKKFVDIEFSIKDKNLFNEVSVIYVSMTKVFEKNNEFYIYRTFYKPQLGNNHIRVKNIEWKGKDKYNFQYGLMLKSDSDKSKPAFEGVKCIFYK